MIEVRSRHRRVRLETPPPPGIASQVLMCEPGTTDAEVLKDAAELLSPAALSELRAILDADDA